MEVVLEGGLNEFQIHTALEGSCPVEELDSLILAMPSVFYVDGALAIRQFTRFLMRLVEWQEKDLGTKLHHAVFIITTDQNEVHNRGLTHDCDECRAGTLRALEIMSQNPEQEMLVGTLYWAGKP